MNVHVLNGDALKENFPLAGDIIVCREALVDGPVDALSFESFFEDRADFIAESFDAEKDSYVNLVRNEFDRLANCKPESPIHLWFEHDLFCQVNLWFILFFIREKELRNPIYIVMPPTDVQNIWSGFGRMNESQLQACLSKRVLLTQADILMGTSLWTAFRNNDFHKLEQFCLHRSDVFPMLKDVCKAHMDRFSNSGLGRPQQKLKSIVDSGIRDFDKIFKEFWKTEGIYGFGDLQVKKMLQDL